jgi:hypothetical protein
MSVMESNTVDFVVPENKDGTALLIIIDQLPWQIDEDDHLVMLQDKINTCLAFVESGQLISDFPKAKSRKVVLQIWGLYAPSAKGEKFIAAVRPIAAQLDIDVQFKLKPQDWAPPDVAHRQVH